MGKYICFLFYDWLIMECLATGCNTQIQNKIMPYSYITVLYTFNIIINFTVYAVNIISLYVVLHELWMLQYVNTFHESLLWVETITKNVMQIKEKQNTITFDSKIEFVLRIWTYTDCFLSSPAECAQKLSSFLPEQQKVSSQLGLLLLHVEPTKGKNISNSKCA